MLDDGAIRGVGGVEVVAVRIGTVSVRVRTKSAVSVRAAGHCWDCRNLY